MSFTRNELKEIGIDDEKIDDVMSLYGKSVQDLKDKEEKARANADEYKKESEMYKERIDEQGNQLDDLKKQVNNGEDLSEQIEALKNANKEKDQQHQDEMNKVKLQYEIDKELNRTGAKNNTAVMALINRDNISFDDEKGLTGLKEQLDDLKESDDYLFVDNNADNNGGTDDNQQNQNSNSDYNAGSGKGNNGSEKDAEAVGRSNYERLFGKSKQNKEEE